jgi:alpha-L-fucosidase
MTDRLTWFHEARFGLFMHWGPYSQLRRGEWVKVRDRIADADYTKMADNWRAEAYDPDAWARAAVAAGMRYVVLTTKHCDGFCLFNTATTDFCASQRGPGRDLIEPYVTACRRHGLKVGFYFSLCDWHDPDFIAHYDPTDIAAWSKPMPNAAAMARYVNLHHRQVRELMTQYGPVDLLWFDANYLGPEVMRSAELVAMVRSLQPQIVINDRSGLPEDYATPEGVLSPVAPSRTWELCDGTHIGWGIEADDPDIYFAAPELLGRLAYCAGAGANLLLNVGPQADGRFPPRVQEQLQAMGGWLARHGEAIFGTVGGPVGRQSWGVITQRGETVYVIAFEPARTLRVRGWQSRIRAARLLDGGAPVGFRQSADGLDLELPRLDPLATVVALTLAEPAVVTPGLPAPEADGRIVLTANSAEIRGTKLYGNCDALGGRLCYWSEAADTAHWHFKAPTPGRFSVQVEYSNIPDAAGSRYSVSVSGDLIEAVAQSSGSWLRFRRDELGVLNLTAGDQTLSIVPVQMGAGGLMCLRRVMLTPHTV